MSTFEQIANGMQGHILFVVLLLLLVWVLYLCVQMISLRCRWAAVAAAVVLLTVGAFLFCLLLDGIFMAYYMQDVYGTRPRDWPEMVKALYRLPWAAIAFGELVYGALCAVLSAFCLRHSRTHVSEHSVKQMLDLLPMGVCVADGEGTVLLSNLKMSEIARKLTGMPLNRYDRLLDAVEAASEPQGEDRLLPELDGETLLFASETIRADGKAYRELTATDVTERYRITKELRANNRRLKDIQLRIKTFRVESSDLLFSRELLRARTIVHDEVGHALLRTGRYLSQPDAEEGAQLLALLRRTNEMLLREAEHPDEVDPWEHAAASAQGIGVVLDCEGQPPEDAALRSLASQALRECAANTIKHSESQRLSVRFSEAESIWEMTLENDTTGPDGGVTETGGLLSLRRTAEQMGVRMELSSKPRFSVKLSSQIVHKTILSGSDK